MIPFKPAYLSLKKGLEVNVEVTAGFLEYRRVTISDEGLLFSRDRHSKSSSNSESIIDDLGGCACPQRSKVERSRCGEEEVMI